MPLDEAVSFVQGKMFDAPEETAASRQALLYSAMAGDREAARQAEGAIAQILRESGVTVPGMPLEEAAHRIYARVWGLDVLEDYYRDPEVDEIRANDPQHVFITRRGKNERVPLDLGDEARLASLIKRMILHDEGISLDRSSPRVESVRKDGSRLTATCPPVTRSWTFALRKHGTFDMSVENLARAGTLDPRVWGALRLLARGRANILFCGNVNSGKTSLMRKLLGELHPNLRILVIGKDLELLLYRHYPERDVIELEEHPEVGASMKELFETALRESPDVIAVEEFRGAGEAVEAIRACTRGHPGSMATAHFNSPEEAVEGTAMLMLEEGLNLPLELAKLRVARSFDVVVQMLGDTVRGIKKLLSVAEIVVGETARVGYRDLIRWRPLSEEFMGPGEWVFLESPSRILRAKMFRFGVTEEMIKKAGWDLDADAHLGSGGLKRIDGGAHLVADAARP
jgi:pilus assembly protein CpaF